MREHVTGFMNYLRVEKQSSPATLDQYGRELSRFFYYLESTEITEIAAVTTSILRSYLYRCKEKRNLSDNSLCTIIAILKSFFNYLFEEEVIKKNPGRKIHTPKKKKTCPRVMTRHEVDRIISAVDFAPKRSRKNRCRDRLILSLLYYTGVRKSELLHLNWDDINLSRSRMIIKSGKGKKDRVIPLHPKLIDLLDEYLTQRLPLKDPALITGEMGKRLTATSFSNLIRMYVKIAGLSKKSYSAHSFRHSFATHLVENGADIFSVQRLMGHASLDSTRVYINFTGERMAKVVACL